MRFRNIKVSGIVKVVFTVQNTVWERRIEYGGNYYWIKPTNPEVRRTHEDIVRTIHHFENRDDANVWVHGDTLNIEYPK